MSENSDNRPMEVALDISNFLGDSSSDLELVTDGHFVVTEVLSGTI